jgi:hypothetical protein
VAVTDKGGFAGRQRTDSPRRGLGEGVGRHGRCLAHGMSGATRLVFHRPSFVAAQRWSSLCARRPQAGGRQVQRRVSRASREARGLHGTMVTSGGKCCTYFPQRAPIADREVQPLFERCSVLAPRRAAPKVPARWCSMRFGVGATERRRGAGQAREP